MAVQPPFLTIHCKYLYSLANLEVLFPMLSAPRPFSKAYPVRYVSDRAVLPSLVAAAFPSIFLAILTTVLQLAEIPGTLSPLFVTLTSCVNPNPCVWHSCAKYPGLGYIHFKYVTHFVSVPSHPMHAVSCSGSKQNHHHETQYGGEECVSMRVWR